MRKDEIRKENKQNRAKTRKNGMANKPENKFLRLNSTPTGIYYKNKYCMLSPATLTEHTKYA